MNLLNLAFLHVLCKIPEIMTTEFLHQRRIERGNVSVREKEQRVYNRTHCDNLIPKWKTFKGKTG